VVPGEDGDFDATTFTWNHFVLAGDPTNRSGDSFGCPDGLMADTRGVLWIQTDLSASGIGRPPLERVGNNAMLAADTRTGEIRRFLVGPVNAEITGATMAPDGRTMFVNIQHPGEDRSDVSDTDNPRRLSNWPDFRANGRPRSATVVIHKNDGGMIGT
jgi:secreted PhoX family phosphatase